MNVRSLTNSMTSKFGRVGLKASKHSPAIMFGAGVVGMVGTVVLASKATLRLEEVLSDHEDKVAQSDTVRAEMPDRYSEKDAKSDKAKIYAGTYLSIAKLYAPAFATGVVSIGLLTGAHVVLNRRYAGAVAAYSVVEKAFKDYRDRVVEDQGADKDREYMYGTAEREVYTERKNGEPKVDRVKTAAGASMYARVMNESNPNWQPNADNTLYFLKLQQARLNQDLQSRGHVFLNDAYDLLGFPRTSEGAQVGWLKNNPNGDNTIDFGIWDDERMDNLVEFMMGKNGELTLDFNVDGIIFRDI